MASKEDLIKGLNEDLSGELGTVIRYTFQASQCFGPAGMEVRELFEEEIPDELGHAAFLMDVIVDLGGEPTTEPKKFDKVKTLKGMIEQDIEMENGDVDAYMKHAAIAEELGLIGIQMKLEEIAADEANHGRELRRLLKGL